MFHVFQQARDHGYSAFMLQSYVLQLARDHGYSASMLRSWLQWLTSCEPPACYVLQAPPDGPGIATLTEVEMRALRPELYQEGADETDPLFDKLEQALTRKAPVFTCGHAPWNNDTLAQQYATSLAEQLQAGMNQSKIRQALGLEDSVPVDPIEELRPCQRSLSSYFAIVAAAREHKQLNRDLWDLAEGYASNLQSDITDDFGVLRDASQYRITLFLYELIRRLKQRTHE